MKKLEIIVKPGKSSVVREAIEAAGYSGITVSQAEGHGTQKGLTKGKSDGNYRLELVPKVVWNWSFRILRWSLLSRLW